MENNQLQDEKMQLLNKVLLWRRVYFQPRALAPMRPLSEMEENAEQNTPKSQEPSSASFLKRRRELVGEDEVAELQLEPLQLSRTPDEHEHIFPALATRRRSRKRRRLEKRAREWDPSSPTSATRMIGRSDTVVVVSSLPKEATEADLKAFGERFGKVEAVRLILAGRRATRREYRRRRINTLNRADHGGITPPAQVPVHAGYGFIAFVRPKEVTTVLEQYARVRSGLATSAQVGQFKIKKQLVVCDREKARNSHQGVGQSSAAVIDPNTTSDPSIRDTIVGRPFVEYFPPANVMGNEGARKDYQQRVNSLRFAKQKGYAAFNAAKARGGPYIPKSLRSVAHLCPSLNL